MFTILPRLSPIGRVTVKSSKQDRAAIGQRMARAYGHPVRAHAMVTFGARVASPREIAEELGEPLGKVSYHVRELRDAGLIQLVETDASSGGVQHFYRATQLPIVDTEAAAQQSQGERAVASEVVINLMASDIAAAGGADTLDSSPERAIVRFHARVDERGLRELSELYTNAMYRSIEIDEESRARLSETGEEGLPVAIHSLLFEMPSIHERPTLSTLEWADGGNTPFPASGGSKGRGADDGGPEG